VKVVWTQRARRQLHAIQKYVGKRSPRGAARMWLRIVERVANQAETPFAAPLERGGPARILVVSQTPYVLTYLVEGDELRVLTVHHGAQRK
jgi:plasmid stabilization system protein ParE